MFSIFTLKVNIENMATKKEFIPKAVYFALEAELKKLLSEIVPYELSEYAQITGEVNEHIIYIEAHQMSVFEKFVGKLKRYKIINFGRPACALHYTSKHKYFLNKKPLGKQVKILLIDSISELEQDYKKCKEQYLQTVATVATEPATVAQELFKNRIEEIQSKKEMYQSVLGEMDNYDFALSNYYRNYVYTTLNYKYFDGRRSDSSQNCFESVSEHIVKNIYSRGELMMEKYNIIFIDGERIEKKIPYQNKEVEHYLGQFNILLGSNLQDLYIKKR